MAIHGGIVALALEPPGIEECVDSQHARDIERQQKQGAFHVDHGRGTFGICTPSHSNAPSMPALIGASITPWRSRRQSRARRRAVLLRPGTRGGRSAAHPTEERTLRRGFESAFDHPFADRLLHVRRHALPRLSAAAGAGRVGVGVGASRFGVTAARRQRPAAVPGTGRSAAVPARVAIPRRWRAAVLFQTDELHACARTIGHSGPDCEAELPDGPPSPNSSPTPAPASVRRRSNRTANWRNEYSRRCR